MNNASLNNLFYDIGISMGLTTCEQNKHECGTYMSGNLGISNGYMWYYIHENYFVVTDCDVLFLKDFKAVFSPQERYITIRLDTAEHISPGKIVSYIEEEYGTAKTTIKVGTRVRYVDVTYFPTFYEKHLNSSFQLKGIKDSPANILKNIGGDHNWPAAMMDILSEIKKCEFTGASATMFYVAKAYELMSELINMGHSRLPAKFEDYSHIVNVIEYIKASIGKEIRQKELVRISKMSGTKLKLLFRQFTGKTITEYLLETKADMASHLLLETELSVEEIATQVGFSTSTGFTTSFKKVMGVPPSDYRKKMRFDCMQNPSQNEYLTFGARN